MSFWPLAKSSRERARALAGHGCVVELGAGEGAFADRLASLGVRPVLVDPRPLPAHGRWPRVRAASPCLPLRDASCGLIVLANTVRHLDGDELGEHAREWRRCLAPGGELWVLEDDPDDDGPAARNYRRCLELLARTGPGRGGALGWEQARDRLSPVLGEAVDHYRETNRTPVEDALAPLGWMRAVGRVPAGEISALERDVVREGMAYGRYWFGAWRP